MYSNIRTHKTDNPEKTIKVVVSMSSKTSYILVKKLPTI